MTAVEINSQNFDTSAETQTFRSSETRQRLRTFAKSAGEKLVGALSMFPAEVDTHLSEHKFDQNGTMHKTHDSPHTETPTFLGEHPYLPEKVFRETEQAKYSD